MAHYHFAEPCLPVTTGWDPEKSFSPDLSAWGDEPAIPATSFQDGEAPRRRIQTTEATGSQSTSALAITSNLRPVTEQGRDFKRNGSRRISRQEWQKHRKTIENQYPLMTLPQLSKFMESNHGFLASPQQWKKKLAEWGLSKNLPVRVTNFIKKKGKERLRANETETLFRLDGQEIPMDKVRRHLRDKSGRVTSSPIASTPSGLSYQTYDSDRMSIGTAASKEDNDIIPSDDPSQALNIGFSTRNSNDLDGLLADSQAAIEFTRTGDYKIAKPLFLGTLDGLTSLLSANHHETIKVLNSFVQAAIENSDFEEATARMHKSYQDHKDALGIGHQKTWQSLARLGKLYRKQMLPGQAYIMLLNAREGLLKAFSSASEQCFHSTDWITKELIQVAQMRGNLEDAEVESRRQIQVVENLGAAYEGHAILLKHNLVHLYLRGDWKDSEGLERPIPRTYIEDLLLDIITNKREIMNFEKAYLCSWEQLRYLYTTTRQTVKLGAFLIKLEDFLGSYSQVTVCDKWLQLVQGIADSCMLLQKWDQALAWLLRKQAAIEQSSSYGPQCAAGLSNIMKIAALYLKRKDREEATPWLIKAQTMARNILDPQHRFHSMISLAVTDGFLDPSLCFTCLVNFRSSEPSTSTSVRKPGESLEELFQRWLYERGYVPNANTIEVNIHQSNS